jgi:hypothetical protein
MLQPRWQIFSSLAFFIVLIACKDTNISQDDGQLMCKVIYSSGDDFSYIINDSESYYAPYPFNIVTAQDQSSDEIMLISKKLNKGTKISVIPLAKMILEEGKDGMKEVIIAVPSNKESRIIDTQDYFEFTVDHFAIKQLIEYWYLNRYGLRGTTLKGWSPTSIDDI